MSDKPVIGFIGVGYMGHGMAKNILKNGYELWIKGRSNRAPVESLVALGAKEASSAKEMAQKCDIIHICLSNSPQVEDIIRGKDGILEGARGGLIVIDTTTADPNSTLALAADLEAVGAKMVDAPLGRTPKEAEEGTLDAMVGADPESYAKALPLIQCWAKAINHIGPVGTGHKMKLLMNFLSGSYAALYSEAATLAVKSGISPIAFRDVIAPGRLGCGFFDTFMRYLCDRDENAHKFSIANMAKDMRYVNAMASDAQVVNVMSAAARHYYTHAEAIGVSDQFIPMLSDHIARLSGVDMAAEIKKARDQ